MQGGSGLEICSRSAGEALHPQHMSDIDGNNWPLNPIPTFGSLKLDSWYFVMIKVVCAKNGVQRYQELYEDSSVFF